MAPDRQALVPHVVLLSVIKLNILICQLMFIALHYSELYHNEISKKCKKIFENILMKR